MAGYDPKRPRRSVEGDAPVDALIDLSEPIPAGTDRSRAASRAADTGAVRSVVPGAETVGAATEGARRSPVVEAIPGPEPADSGRARLLVGIFLGAAFAVVAVLLIRRRHRR